MGTKRYPPGPKGQPVIGNLIEFRSDPLGFLQRMARDYGDVVHFKMGRQDAFFINNPDHIKNVLVTHHSNFVKSRGLYKTKRVLGEGVFTSEGERHSCQRHLLHRSFTQNRVAACAPVMINHAARLRRRWEDGALLDVTEAMTRLTLGIVAEALLSADVESEGRALVTAIHDIRGSFSKIKSPLSKLLEKIPLPGNRRFEKACRRLDAVIGRVVSKHLADDERPDDLVSALLAARDEEGSGAIRTQAQVYDEIRTILLVGHETTAIALAWTWYLLSRHPGVEEKLHEELDGLLAGRLPAIYDVPNLRYTKKVFAEAMRLYPPAWVLGRRPMSDYAVDEYVLPAGSMIIMSQYVMHRDARYFKDPFRFDPERWTPEAEAAMPRFAYFPFGGGPRGCLGEMFAWTEGLLLIATLAQQWRMRPASARPVEPKPMITLHPGDDMRMTLERRRISEAAP